MTSPAPAHRIFHDVHFDSDGSEERQASQPSEGLKELRPELYRWRKKEQPSMAPLLSVVSIANAAPKPPTVTRLPT
jgi:hypothetical protein